MDGVDWDLNAVVRGCRRKDQAAVDPFASFLSPLPEEKQQKKETEASMCFSTFTSWQRGEVEGLEELCKPFFCSAPPQQQNHLVSQRRDFPSPPSSSAVAAVGPAARVRQQQQQQLSQLPRSKRRKNQQKKVVCHVPADGVSSDVWAWRKYGQKPIKGSPYPRGYYRCSSSKGCPARKQVERSRADPATFIITYTADHNHAVPSHRNSLAGSTRQKLPLAVAAVEHPPSSSSTGLSPTTPLTASMEEEEDEDDEEEELLVEDMEVIGEDDLLFVGGEGEGDATAGPKAANCVDFFDGGDDGFDDRFFAPPSWLANNNAAAAAGGS